MAVKYQSFLALQASAGSGKTFSLSLHYLFLLFKEEHLNPAEILALTFTRKAANEMKQKITHTLKLLASVDEELNEDYLKEKKDYLKALEEYGNISAGEIIQNAPKVYRKFLGSALKIMTLDSFFHAILRKFCWYAQTPYDFITQDTFDHTLLLDHFLKHLTPLARKELLELSLQEKWYSLNDSYRFFENIFEKSHESSALLDAFDGEVLFDPKIYLEYAKAFQAKILQDLKASDSAKKAVAFKDLYELREKKWLQREDVSDYKYFKKLDSPKIELQPLLEGLRQEIKQSYLASEDRILFRVKQIFYFFKQSLQKWHKQHKTLSVQDVMLRVHHLLCSQTINTDFLYFRLDAKITHILIDEFQDTSILQYQILEPLIDEILAGLTRKHNRSFFYVGDVKQSIYYFRGSKSELFDYVSESKKIPLDHLEYNWRSREEIVAFVNRTFQDVYKNFVPQIAKKEGGYVRVVHVDVDDLKQQVVAIVQELLDRGIAQEDIALLTFKNSDIINIADALKEAIPHILIVKEGSASLKEHIEVKALYYALYYLQSKNKIHKMRVLSLVNERKEDDFLDTLSLQKPAAIIKAIMEHFALFSLSARKFLEFSLQYQDITGFLEWVNCSNEKQPKEKLKGVRILTIHSSKGLEFQYTIVCDRLSNNSNTQEKILFDYHQMQIQKIFTTQKNREYFDDDYKQAKLREQKYKEQEQFNLLYVAFTRAKSSLHIIQKRKSSSFEKLSLESCVCGELSVDGVSEESHTIQSIVKITQKDLGRQRLFLRKENGHFPEENYAMKDIQKGNAFHLALESFLKYDMKQEEVLNLLLNRMGYWLDIDVIHEILKKCEKILKNSFFLEFLSKGKVECEVSFLDGDCVRRIDLLVVGEDEVCIVDYKSGNPNKEEYIRQVQSYMRIASAYYRKPSKGYILTLEGNFIVIE